MARKITLLALVAVLALAVPVGARSTCPTTRWFDGVSGRTIRVNDAATEKKPVSITFSHEAAAGALVARDLADIKYFPVQVVTRNSLVGLNVALEWETPSADEIDLFLQDPNGEYLAASDGTNLPLPLEPEDYPEGQGLGAMGQEHIADFLSVRCNSFVVQSEALRTPGREVTLKLWLNPDPEL